MLESILQDHCGESKPFNIARINYTIEILACFSRKVVKYSHVLSQVNYTVMHHYEPAECILLFRGGGEGSESTYPSEDVHAMAQQQRNRLRVFCKRSNRINYNTEIGIQSMEAAGPCPSVLLRDTHTLSLAEPASIREIEQIIILTWRRRVSVL